ncbi:C-5 sterol desaturase [Sugiyamaella lignohabitans]|uniref:C-5 sterol desaturase n=1 Tax=Sugiyamaella lignohabitans TaxID=796027 RepID=A0A167FFQ0_9ASCO|nr:C-5 sterol desaturase [Sugiyamaella lignohabitans]ANB15242.1 C-5 sterol desaturase [Sugiyamaella lignohabitans]
MDIVLEIFDTLVFDKAYAKVFPKDGILGKALQTNIAKAASHASQQSEVAANFYNQTVAPQVDLFVSNYVPPSVYKWAVSLGSTSMKLLPSPTGSERHVYGLQPTYYFKPTEFATQSVFARDSIFRQSFSIFLITWIFGYTLYLLVAGLSYKFVYDPANFKHPKYLKNQVRMELRQSLTSIPVMTLFTVPWFVWELRGYSKLYYDADKYGLWYIFFQFPLFLLFTDMNIYFIHRWLHSPGVYKRLHKPHHKWIVPTPFASHAFHPMDGYLQSIPYHVFPFIFPLHKIAYVVLFMIINVWTVMIHDGEYLAHDPVINGSACHTIHHLYFNYNYGQYTTLWDRLGGSYRTPDKELFNKSLKTSAETWKKQTATMESIRKEVEEDDDDRVYAGEVDQKKNQ